MRRILASTGMSAGALLVLALWVDCAAGAETSPAEARYRSAFDRYCVTCHNDSMKTAGLSIETLDVGAVGASAAVWEKVVHKVGSGAMPPPGRPRPPVSMLNELVGWLEAELDRYAAEHPNPGRPAVHRLNRTEYQNSIRDLLALEIDSRELLPADDLGYGFDNIADTLSFSPMLLERYLSVARRISRLAIGDPSIHPSVEIYSAAKVLVQDERMSEELPFGSRGGLVVRHRFPLDGDYELQVSLAGRRMGEETLEVRVDGERVGEFAVDRGPRSGPSGTPELELRFAAQAGTRTVGVSFLAARSVPEGVGPSRLPAGNILAASGGSRRSVRSLQIGGPFDPRGPGDTASRRKIFVCQPVSVDEPAFLEEDACAELILSSLARRAYRRPAEADDVEALLAFYTEGRARGDFDAGIQRALERILVDPEFLFRLESDPSGDESGAAYEISDLELASRLSFFLWSSLPDDELLATAERGELKQPGVLEGQVLRMLGDERSDALVDNFAAQWLHLRNVRAAMPDVNRYPEFDDNLRLAFQRETELFLRSQLREDRSVLDLLGADYTFVNERLARHYDLRGVYGNRFRRVVLEDESRRGLLGHGSILTVTSYANRTSPVLRGKWLLENLLGAPPPAPPADVPELSDSAEGEAPASIREQMEEHRRDPACSGCHSLMDPLGFALENFDAIGKWRDAGESGAAIDASGRLPDGTSFDGPAELREVLLGRQRDFVATLTGKLLTYSLGRGVEYYDQPAIRQILRQAEADDYRWSSIILGIVESTPFRMRTPRMPTPPVRRSKS